MLLHLIDIFLLSDNDTALGASQKLVPGEQDHIRIRLQGIHYRRLIDAVSLEIHHEAVAHVIDDRDPLLSAQGHHIRQGYILRESDDAEVGGVDLHEGCRKLRIIGPLVVGDLGLVGGSHLPQDGA